jgi:hypothetical protein
VLSPSGSRNGGGATLTVSGGPFLPAPVITCLFGGTTASATYITSAVVMCVIPNLSSVTVVFEIRNNGQDASTTGTLFPFYGTTIRAPKRLAIAGTDRYAWA